MSGQGTVRVGGWRVGRKQFAREADWKIGVIGASHQPGDLPVKRDIIIDRPGGFSIRQALASRGRYDNITH